MNDEEITAYVDGEMPAAAARRFEMALERDPVLRNRVDGQKALRDSLRAGFAPALSEPVPEILRKTAMTAPVSWRWRLRSLLKTGGRSGGVSLSFSRVALATAVALVIGVVVGRNLQVGVTGLIGSANGIAIARGSLASNLDSRLASEAGGGPHIGVTFRNHAGEICRTFASPNSSGIACRTGDGWRIAALVDREPERPNDFHAAADEMPDSIRDAVNGMIAGDPFDAIAERKARDAGWK